MRLTWHLGDALGDNLLTLGLGLSLKLIVCADTVGEGDTGLTLADMLNANVDALWDYSSTNSLVDNNTYGMLGHIEDLAGLTVVDKFICLSRRELLSFR